MSLSERYREDIVVLEPSATRLDADAARDFRRSLLERTAKVDGDIIVDLSRVEFVDSTALGALVAAYKRYVRLASQSAGAVVGGEAMPALPPSVLTVLEAGGTSGSFTPIRSTIVGEWDLPTPDVIKGSRSLRLNVEPR